MYISHAVDIAAEAFPAHRPWNIRAGFMMLWRKFSSSILELETTAEISAMPLITIRALLPTLLAASVAVEALLRWLEVRTACLAALPSVALYIVISAV